MQNYVGDLKGVISFTAKLLKKGQCTAAYALFKMLILKFVNPVVKTLSVKTKLVQEIDFTLQSIKKKNIIYI